VLEDIARAAGGVLSDAGAKVKEVGQPLPRKRAWIPWS
jgi:hypothetical protein